MNDAARLKYLRIALVHRGRSIWIADAHGYGKHFIVRADEMLTAFVGVQRALRAFAVDAVL